MIAAFRSAFHRPVSAPGLPPLWVALVLGVVTLLTRIPFRTLFLYHWDSVNYALALERFDVWHHQPHPPGYLLYVLLARALEFVLADANAAYVWLSLVASAVAVALLYLVASELFDRRTGLWASLIFASSPLFWFYGEVALPYTLDAAVSLCIVWGCLRTAQGQRGALWLSALLLGLAGGIRPQTTIILFPLWLWAIHWQTRARIVIGFAVVVLASLAWFLPLAYLSGGVFPYLHLLSQYSSQLRSLSPLGSLFNFGANLGRLVGYLFYALPLGLPVLVYGAVRAVGTGTIPGAVRRVTRSPAGQRVTTDPHMAGTLLGLWLLPPLGFYILVLLQQPGYVIVILPVLAILVVRIVSGSRTPLAVFGSAILAASVLFFLFAPPRLGSLRLSVLMVPSARALQARDRFLTASLATIESKYDPNTTAILGVSQLYHHPDYYLRAFKNYTAADSAAGERVLVPPGIRTLVVFGNPNEGDWQLAPAAHRLSLSPTEALYVVTASAGEQLYVDEKGYGVVTP